MAALNWQTLKERQDRMRVAMLHRIVHNLVDIPRENHLTEQSHNYDTRGAHVKFHIPQFRLNVYRNSFFPSAIALWNPLDRDITAVTDPGVFRAGLEAVRLAA